MRRLDRRQHKRLITRNTEYHLRDRECVGVRDRKTGAWLSHHDALRTRLIGAVDRAAEVSREPRLGTRLVFVGGRKNLVTSPLVQIDRPQKAILERYTWRVKSGLILTPPFTRLAVGA